ncbi:MAG: hypothetical protein WBY88_06290 [Desulfosarcina sp.]
MTGLSPGVETVLVVLAGLAMLTLGRRLFWLFVGLAGFVAGLQAAHLFFDPGQFWMLWAAGLLCGIVGVLLALFVQHLAIIVGGFLAGVTITIHLMPMLGHDAGVWIPLIGGILGVVGLYLLFDWALIVLSSVVGAALIVEAVGQRFPYLSVLFIILVAGGVVIQSLLLMASRKTAD